MTRVLEGLEPAKVFTYFEQICQIPHGSYHVKQISDYLVDFATQRQLEVYQDREYNVLIKKPASAGMEDAPVLILQGHMDMVCEKDKDCHFDFLKDPLQLVLNGDDISAKGTTLGGDDGIALAYGMAILDDDEIVHPGLEILFTTQEETGMEGAFAFDINQLQGHYMINLDSEEEGNVLTSCAGGETVVVSYPLLYEKPSGTCYILHIHGLLGGHSGADIHLGRANAIVLMGQLLYVLHSTGVNYQLASFDAKGKHNAIPREATAYIYLDETKWEAVKIVIDDFIARVHNEFGNREPSIAVDYSPCEKTFQQVYCDFVKDALVDSIAHVFDGVCRMSKELEDMVETSSNLGVVWEEENTVKVEFLVRSSVDGELDKAVDVISYVIMQGAANYLDHTDPSVLQTCKPIIERNNRYPGWQYRPDSKLRALVKDVYRQQYHREMKETGIHAGLECGIFASQGDFDIISIGPDILDIHTPKETLKVASTQRTYELLLELLRRAGEL